MSQVITRAGGADFQVKSATFSGAGGAAEHQLVAAVAGKRIIVVGYSISVDGAARVVIYHGDAESAVNVIGGGYFAANGGAVQHLGDWALSDPAVVLVNQKVEVKFSAAVNGVVTVHYIER